jgi:HAD superfamily hydrolase (TIGR01459 family)
MDRPFLPDFASGLAELAPRYRAILCDVWGVVHNGKSAFPLAGAALAAFRAAGGIVVLITNGPRPSWSIRLQLDDLGVVPDAYDAIVSSGDLAAAKLATKPGARVCHIGPERDLVLYRALPLTLTGPDEADVVCCTGLANEYTEMPEDYDLQLRAMRARDLPFLCANPDIWVEAGNRLIPCAGALAERYRAIGGTTTILGKPHPEIYALALSRIDAIAGMTVPRETILAIGDGAHTDVRGANQTGLPVLFITGGIHAGEYGDDAEQVRGFLARSDVGADALMPRLSW